MRKTFEKRGIAVIINENVAFCQVHAVLEKAFSIYNMFEDKSSCDLIKEFQPLRKVNNTVLRKLLEIFF